VRLKQFQLNITAAAAATAAIVKEGLLLLAVLLLNLQRRLSQPPDFRPRHIPSHGPQLLPQKITFTSWPLQLLPLPLLLLLLCNMAAAPGVAAAAAKGRVS
jgi:hypothetical protein